jgi:nitrogen fixation NifU-like protein
VSELDDLYRETLLDHYRHPRGSGRLEPSDLKAEGENPLCGDQLELFLRVEDGRVSEAGFVGRGCAVSQAATSMLMERLVGMTLAEAKAFDKEQLLEELAIPLTPVRLKCALLGLETLKAALREA